MKILLIIIAFMLVGCVHYQTPINEVLIKQNKQCIDGGMKPVTYLNSDDFSVYRIVCYPKKD